MAGLGVQVSYIKERGSPARVSTGIRHACHVRNAIWAQVPTKLTTAVFKSRPPTRSPSPLWGDSVILKTRAPPSPIEVLTPSGRRRASPLTGWGSLAMFTGGTAKGDPTFERGNSTSGRAQSYPS